MTFDEKLDRLTERHEALTQSVELLMAENRQTAAENKQAAAENKAENKLRDQRMGEIMEAIARLVHVAEMHEQRLDAHEDRLDDLDQKG